MSEELSTGPMPFPEPPKKKPRRTLLIVIGVILGTSCLACTIGLYVMGRPGKPIPPTAFIDEATRGIVVFRADAAHTGLRELLAYAAASALEHSAAAEREEMLEFLKEEQTGTLPSTTIAASYKGDDPDTLRSFAVVVLTETPRIYQWVAARLYGAMSKGLDTQTYQGANIMSGGELLQSVREKIEEEKGARPGALISPLADSIIEQSQLSLYESCFFFGRSTEDVTAGIAALQAPEPAAEAAPPFMELYDHADSSALFFGALSNENGILLAALYPNAEDREDARDWLEPKLTLDPRQVKKIAFSADLVSADEAIIKLWMQGANEEIAKQIAVAVQSLVASKLNTTEDIALEFAIDESTTGTDGSVYEGTIKVTGIKAFIDQCFERLRQEQKAKEETEKPPATPHDEPEEPDALLGQ